MELACLNVQILFVFLDEDECTSGTHNCSVNAVCNNTQGSHNCTCIDGFHRDGINCTGNYLLHSLILVSKFCCRHPPIPKLRTPPRLCSDEGLMHG